MSKELFNQPLITSPTEPDDADQLALGQPSVQGGKNITWARFKEIINSFISLFDSIKFNTSYTPVSTVESEIWWNGKYHTINMNTGLYDDVIKLGQDQFYVFYNDTGVDIDPFKVLHLKGAALFNGELYPTFELADPRNWENIQGTLAISCCTIANGTLGILIRNSQKITGGETLGIPAGSQLWIAADGTGSLTATKPSFQDYALSVGGNYNEVGGTDGEIFVSFTGSIDDDFHNAWDGGIRETFNFTTSSDGVNVTGLLENVINTRDLTCFFSDVGRYTLDTTTAPLTIALTPGTDGNEQKNYVYIPIETKVLTVSTSGWPLTEHCRVAELEIQSAATTQADGGTLGNQNTNDHLKKENDNGHIMHIAAWIRKQFATFESGTEATFDNISGNGYIDITGGIANQLHEQTLPAFSMIGGDFIRAWNDNGGLRPKLSNLASITAYSDGSSWNNEWGKIVVWRVVNKSGEYAPVMFNLPSGGYNSEANALDDLQQKADYSIPNNFKTKAILIAAFTFRISGGVITYNTGYENLRGQLPITVAGGSGGGGGGATTLLALTDTPSSYTDQAGKVLVVNSAENGLEFGKSLRDMTQTPESLDGVLVKIINVDNDVKTFSFDSGVTSQEFLIDGTGGSNTIENTCKRILDNSGNANDVTITWSNAGLDWTWKGSIEPTTIEASKIYTLEIQVESTGIALAELKSKDTDTGFNLNNIDGGSSSEIYVVNIDGGNSTN